MHPRLIGVETEYALAWVPREPGARAPLPRDIYQLVEAAVRAEIPTLPAALPKSGIFLSTGGLLHYEAPTARFSKGLLEMATPECRGALEAARYHHGQDELLGRVHQEVEFRLRTRGFDGELVIGKAAADTAGNVWGSHENYEVDEPPGALRRLLVALVFPVFWIPVLLVEVALIVMFYAFLLFIAAAYHVCTALAHLPGAGRPFAAAARGIVGLGRAAFREESLTRLMDLTYAVTIPWIRVYSLFLRFIVLPRTRQLLLPHLVTRLVFCGPGRVEAGEGRLALSHKGPAIRVASGIFWDDDARPVFDLKNFVREPWSIWKRRKRLQVLFADSNTSRLATALRLGTTDLVLRMIEAGHPLRDFTPRDLRQAIAIVDGDVSLRASIPLAAGGSATALEIQRHFLEEAEKFCGTNAEPETAEILSKWRFVLGALAEDPHLLYKDLDWVAKRDLVAEALAEDGGWRGVAVATAGTATAATAQKIDTRFHEIGPRGYGHVLREAGQSRPYFSAEELDRATREPASSPRAKARGEAVKRHAGDDREARVSWTTLLLKRPRQKIPLE
ncbi:MAG: proteasome accessory factor PafA2 family protein [Planctomycetes bacterium]|nr:proteasome accessory factor PafA2 family protein [Planctomycetota bacterium]